MNRFVLGLAIAIACNVAVAQNAQTVTVRNLTLVNLTQVPVEDYQQILQFALDNTKLPLGIDPSAAISQRVRYALQERGYFLAEIRDPEITVVSESPTKKVVDVSVNVDTGSIYKLEQLIFAGNRAFPAALLRAQLSINPGEVFDTEKVRIGLENLRKFYADAGYINFTPVPNTYFVEGRSAIVLKIELDEGVRFYFGDLKISVRSTHPDATWILNSDWSSLKGKPYNGTEMEEFMKQHSELLPAGFRPERNLEVRQDGNTHTVNVEIVP